MDTGRVTACVRYHVNNSIHFERTIKQTMETMPLLQLVIVITKTAPVIVGIKILYFLLAIVTDTVQVT